MSAEPSMEEILSSIKRIIAEEGEGPIRSRRTPRAALPPPAQEEPEVLELSDAVAAADVSPEPAEEPAPEPAPAPVQAAPAPTTPAQTAPVEAPAPRTAEPAPESILSPRTAEASRTSLDTLSRAVVKPEGGGEAVTLEGVVREMLRPMLREWLDANLPPMVETMVATEIARISGQPR